MNNILPFTMDTSIPHGFGGYVTPSGKTFEELTAPVVLTPEFAEKLRAFNQLTREFRAADIGIEAMAFPDNKIFIHRDSAVLLSTHFGKELRGIRNRSDGRYTRHVVTIRAIDVIWFVPLKEQDQ
jgi:hypothetical protein